MHSQSPFTLQETEYYTLGLHIPQQSRPQAHLSVPAPRPAAASVPASANVSIQLSYPPPHAPAVPPAPPPSLQQIKTSMRSVSSALYTDANLGRSPPFVAFQYASGPPGNVAAVIGRDRTDADSAVRAVAGMDGGLSAFRPARKGWSGYASTLGGEKC